MDRTFCSPIKGLFLLPFKGKGEERNVMVLCTQIEEELAALRRAREALVEELSLVFPRSGKSLPLLLYVHRTPKAPAELAYLFWRVRNGHRQSESKIIRRRITRLATPEGRLLLAKLPVGVRRIYLEFDLRAMKLDARIAECMRTLAVLNGLRERIAAWQVLWEEMVVRGQEPDFPV